MLPRDKVLKETSPLSIFLVKSGSGGNRLLFRYPYDEQFINEQAMPEQDRLLLRSVISENDNALSNMFAVNPNLCGQKFEIKINKVRHVGHPISLLSSPATPTTTTSTTSDKITSCSSNPISHTSQSLHTLSRQPHYSHKTKSNFKHVKQEDTLNRGDITSFNIVCALRASASYDIVDCYHDLSKRLTIALSFEERRCSYLSKEIKTILATLEESDMAKMVACQDGVSDNRNVNDSKFQDSFLNNQRDSNHTGSVFSLIAERSNLSKDLKRVYESLCTTGIVELKINNWVNVSFCLPQKVHRLHLLTHKSMPAISTQDIYRCLFFLRPYHGLLLLSEHQELLDALPIDASPAMIQLIRVTRPDKNLVDLSVDANLTLMHVFCLVSQLIYWAKATVIYPICDSNIYAIHPLASTGLQSKLVSDFGKRFPTSKSLHHYLADFSEGISLSQLNGPLLTVEDKLNLLSIVTWLLQRRILSQIHKYVFLVVDTVSKSYVQNSSGRQTVQPRFVSQPAAGEGQSVEANSFVASNGGSSLNNNNSNSNSNNNGSSLFKADSFKLPWSNGGQQGNSIGSSPQMFKHSFTESLEGSFRRYRADSLPESQEDSNFGLNSSLSSTPNSNLEYPSPGNELHNKSSLSSSCPLDNAIGLGDTESILSALQRLGWTQASIKSILAIPSSKSADDLRLLVRLIPYFDGKHHIEDMMFFENMERSQVLILCDKFRDILFTCHYEDVAVSQLSPFDIG